MAAFRCFRKGIAVSYGPVKPAGRFGAALQRLSLLSEYPNFSFEKMWVEVYAQNKGIILELIWLKVTFD